MQFRQKLIQNQCKNRPVVFLHYIKVFVFLQRKPIKRFMRITRSYIAPTASAFVAVSLYGRDNRVHL